MIDPLSKKQIGAIATGSLFAIMLFLANSHAVLAATTYNYTCSVFAGFIDSGATCTDSPLSISGTTWSAYDGSLVDPLSVGTWYVTLNETGLGGDVRCVGGSCTAIASGPGVYSDVPLTCTGSTCGIYLHGTAGQTWSVTSLCVTDTPGACSGGGGGNTQTGKYNCVTAASSTDCLVQVVDNPVGDLFDGFILFGMTAFGIIWFFRRRS